jgi:hypothetical protein
MSNLTLALEIQLEEIKDLLQEASKYRGEVDPLYVRDLVAALQVEIEDALTPKCKCCGDALEEIEVNLMGFLCSDCYRNQTQKSQQLCPQCGCLFIPRLGELECPECMADWKAHREEVRRAHAATNGTL